MGGDGGSIPKRIELVRSRQKPEQVAKEAELAARWLHCQLSQELLQRPIVACQLGRLYNKTAVLEFLLDREKFEGEASAAAAAVATFRHLRSLRDVRELRLADNPEHRPGDVAKGNSASGGFGHATAPPFVCPLSGVEVNGRFRFVFPWSCGCVIAEKALERLNSGGGNSLRNGGCPVCQKPDALADLVPLNPSSEAEVAAAEAKRQERRKAAAAASTAAAAAKRKAPPPASSAPVSTASGGNKVARLASGVVASTSSSSSARGSGSSGSSGGGSIQDNPNASEALKSLFTSSKEAKSQAKAHWVTFNPGYFR